MGETQMQVLQRIEAGQARIEGKLDQLLDALAEDETQPQRTLEGDEAGRERDQTQSLDSSDPK